MRSIPKRSIWVAGLTALTTGFLLPGLILDAYALSFSPAGNAQIPELYSELVPTWTGGVLVSIESRGTATPIIHSFDETGQETLPIAVSIPDAQEVQIAGFSRGSGGAFALTGWTVDRQGHREGFLSLVSPDHKTIQTVRLAPYSPRLVAFAPDGTIWTVGAEIGPRGSEKDPSVNLNHGVIRHFDKNLAPIASFLPQSSIKPVRGGYMASNKDRIGWYPRLSEAYYEVSFDGKVSHFTAVPLPTNHFTVRGFALTDDGEAFVTVGELNKETQLYRLDRGAGAWVPITAPPGTRITLPGDSPRMVGPELFGGDGTRLAFRGYDEANGWEIKFFNVTEGQQSSAQ